jgi:hypothetical protein
MVAPDNAVAAVTPRLDLVVLDCPDPAGLADFYARLLGWPAPPAEDVRDTWVTVRDPAGGVGMAFQADPHFQAPTWPDPQRPQMVHLDLAVTDMAAAREHTLAVGGRELDLSEEHPTFQVYADPVGHPFCLCTC